MTRVLILLEDEVINILFKKKIFGSSGTETVGLVQRFLSSGAKGIEVGCFCSSTTLNLIAFLYDNRISFIPSFSPVTMADYCMKC